jgi:hypothetical protein
VLGLSSNQLLFEADTVPELDSLLRQLIRATSSIVGQEEKEIKKEGIIKSRRVKDKVP